MSHKTAVQTRNQRARDLAVSQGTKKPDGPHSVLFITELLERILSLAAYPESEDGDDEAKVAREAIKNLWRNLRPVCKFWKTVVETSTSPLLASLSFTAEVAVGDNFTAAQSFSICPLTTNFAMRACHWELNYWGTGYGNVKGDAPGWTYRVVDRYRWEKLPKRFATYPTVTIMRALASQTAITKKRIKMVNSAYLRQRRTEVTWDDTDKYWFFETENMITAENFIAFTCAIYEAGGPNYTTNVEGRTALFVRVEFLGPNEEIVGHVDVPCGRGELPYPR
ncbi:hypothetical protein AA313_de0207386 [Arthrobotrys entomopaga]|nr:hypothetical protein AA313_de0207386 [Arthrobotrys entomopaga]